MINEQLIDPQSIVVVGASNNLQKPGGKILHNILECYRGDIYVVNTNQGFVQGVKSYPTVHDLPKEVDLAVIAVAAKYCPSLVKSLIQEKNTTAFIIISAGFSEENAQGAQYEKEVVEAVEAINGCLIGPNCIGIINVNHHSIFTQPIPMLDPAGADFISGSGATAVFILETGVGLGLKFNSIFSVGNSAQIGVEDVLAYLDETFDPDKSSRIKLLYIESITNPDKLLHHANSLVHKGCKIAAIKSGTSEAGMRASQSHTGAMASPDTAVDALFKKAGIVRCHGRLELATVAAVFMAKELKGDNMAVITHAGGPAVMLTDSLSQGGIKIPPIEGPRAELLRSKLHHGSSVGNPIDFLATGTAEQLGEIIDACEKDFDHIDAMAVIFGSPGLFPVREVYEVLHQKMRTCQKPIYPILPSVVNADDDIKYFLSKGNVNFPDEVMLGHALSKVHNSIQPAKESIQMKGVDVPAIRALISGFEEGYLPPQQIQKLFSAAGIPMLKEIFIKDTDELAKHIPDVPYPCVMKVVGPIHKSDVGGVSLNINSSLLLEKEFHRLMAIEDAKGVIIQPMLQGTELFIGAKYEQDFGHVMLCGLGGIFVEVLKDVSSGLAPLSEEEALGMIDNLKGKQILRGVRGQEGINIVEFADIIVRLSTMLRFAVEIKELDINPLIGNENGIMGVDARVRIEKEVK
ncbi:acetyltransferase [Saccharicrinis carchari]|uniref:Acetyltransferase n=1 Tax=Saccharicrinis carchari TaxID=1168039 RepID=A0A521DBT3_SACCC|nr:acetate--CoA ligase family protein [Saccharicrinis carchari]SMO69032.1 acetyltransferase [Saccharicrinis carchari]